MNAIIGRRIVYQNPHAARVEGVVVAVGYSHGGADGYSCFEFLVQTDNGFTQLDATDCRLIDEPQGGAA